MSTSKLVTTAKVSAWVVTTAISAVALFLALDGRAAQNSAKVLNQEQSRQLVELQRTNPTGQIATIVPYQAALSDPAAINNVRHNPFVLQQLVDIYGLAQNVPDNGDLFVVVHNYGARTSGSLTETNSLYFVTPANLLFGTSVVNQRWKSPGVYIGGAVPPNVVTSYRLSLYFCDSADSKSISAAISNKKKRNAGFSSMPYPSCKQLDSIFVRRRP